LRPVRWTAALGRFRGLQAQCQLMVTNDYDALLSFPARKAVA